MCGGSLFVFTAFCSLVCAGFLSSTLKTTKFIPFTCLFLLYFPFSNRTTTTMRRVPLRSSTRMTRRRRRRRSRCVDVLLIERFLSSHPFCFLLFTFEQLVFLLVHLSCLSSSSPHHHHLLNFTEGQGRQVSRRRWRPRPQPRRCWRPRSQPRRCGWPRPHPRRPRCRRREAPRVQAVLKKRGQQKGRDRRLSVLTNNHSVFNPSLQQPFFLERRFMLLLVS